MIPKGFCLDEENSREECRCVLRKEGIVELRIKEYTSGKFEGEILLPSLPNDCAWLQGSCPKVKYYYFNAYIQRDSMAKLLLHLTEYALRLQNYMNAIDTILSYPLDACKDDAEKSLLIFYREGILKRRGNAPKNAFNLDFECLEFMDFEVCQQLLEEGVDEKRVIKLLNAWAPRSLRYTEYGDYVLKIVKGR